MVYLCVCVCVSNGARLEKHQIVLMINPAAPCRAMTAADEGPDPSTRDPHCGTWQSCKLLFTAHTDGCWLHVKPLLYTV